MFFTLGFSFLQKKKTSMPGFYLRTGRAPGFPITARLAPDDNLSLITILSSAQEKFNKTRFVQIEYEFRIAFAIFIVPLPPPAPPLLKLMSSIEDFAGWLE